MGPYVDSIAPDLTLPAATRVVVIGGGIIGTSAALSLAARGVPVVLCEKAHIACEQSGRNWGWCRQAGRDEREMPLIVESLRLWRDMDRLTGGNTGFRQSGVMYVGESEADEIRFNAWLAMAQPFELGARILCGKQLEELMPGAQATYRCALHVPTDGCAEPQKAAPAIARAAQRLGATILSPCAVRGIERRGGRVSAAVTEWGRIECDAIILAGGAWSSLFCASLGLPLPQLKVLSTVMRTAPVAAGPTVSTILRDVAYRQRADGGYTVARGTAAFEVPLVPDSWRYLSKFWPSLRQQHAAIRPRLNAQSWLEFTAARHWALDGPSPFERMRVLDPRPNQAFNRQAREALVRLYPQFQGVPIVQEWAGYIDVSPDVIPYIGAVAAVPGLTIATGFSGHGFGIGPGAGWLAADIATAQKTTVDPTAFRVSRFTDGSPVVIGAEL